MVHTQQHGNDSELFMVRIWTSGADPGDAAHLSGKVQHVISGRAVSFDSWEVLTAFMAEMLRHDTVGTADTPNLAPGASDGHT